MSKIYAVKVGVQPGIYNSWDECEKQVKGYPGAEFKRFDSMERDSAEKYIHNKTIHEISESDNQPPSDNRYHVYVDGSYVDGQYSWAFVVYHYGQELYSEYGVGLDQDMASMRNVAGEITAAMKAVEWAIQKSRHIIIYHDYAGISAWVNGHWNANKKHTRNYAYFMQNNQKYFQFRKVKGHSGNIGNERADELAYQAFQIK